MSARTGVLSMLRAAVIVLAAACSAVVLPRFGAQWPGPDLVLPVVVAAGLLGGSARGALVGLGAGWVVDLMPPAAATLGVGALTYAAVGAASGLLHRDGGRSAFLPPLATLVAAGIVAAVGILRVVETGRPVPWASVGWSVAMTTAVGVAVVPVLISTERALMRRRLT
jgi:hypothetical protein